jgi:hypothetical protein
MPLVAATPLNVEPHDREVAERALTTVARCRFVTRASLLAALGPSGLRPDMTDAWVAGGLLHQGRVTVDPLSTHDSQYLALTRLGGRVLSSATGTNVEGLSPAILKRSSQKRCHDVCVGEVALAVLTLAAEGQLDLVGVETDDQRLHLSVLVDEPGQAPERITLRPDALVVTAGAMGKSALVVETDRGTVSLPTMQRRYAGYVNWARAGGPCGDFGIKALRVLTVVPTEARLKALHDAALKANRGRPSGFLLFALQGDLSVCVAERMLGPVAHQLGAVPGHRVPLFAQREPPGARLART